jgi:hypothetical protein
VPTDLSRDQLRRLARLGALSRLEELRKEEAAIRAAFPDLARGAGKGRPASGAAATPVKRKRRRRKMSAAEKKAVSDRMKKYWAERRKAR